MRFPWIAESKKSAEKSCRETRGPTIPDASALKEGQSLSAPLRELTLAAMLGRLDGSRACWSRFMKSDFHLTHGNAKYDVRDDTMTSLWTDLDDHRGRILFI